MLEHVLYKDILLCDYKARSTYLVARELDSPLKA